MDFGYWHRGIHQLLYHELCHKVRRFWILKFEIRRTSRKNQNSLKFGFRFDHEIYGSIGMSRWQVNLLMFRLGFGHKNCESAGRQWRRVVLCLDGVGKISHGPQLFWLLNCAIVQTCADGCFHLEQPLCKQVQTGLPTWSSHCDWVDLDNL